MSIEKTKAKLATLLIPQKTVIIGLGNPNRADDGVGFNIASLLQETGIEHVYIDDRALESNIFEIKSQDNIQNVLFIDAVDLKQEPGFIKILNAAKIKQREISSHKVPLQVYTKLLMGSGKKVFLVGIQPQTLEFKGHLSKEVLSAQKHLTELLFDALKSEV